MNSGIPSPQKEYIRSWIKIQIKRSPGSGGFRGKKGGCGRRPSDGGRGWQVAQHHYYIRYSPKCKSQMLLFKRRLGDFVYFILDSIGRNVRPENPDG